MSKLQHKEDQFLFYQKVGDRIRGMRKVAGITQDDLAMLLSISRVSVNCIEAGKQRLPLHIIGSICHIFKCKYDDLLPEFIGDVKSISDLFEEKTILVKKSRQS